MGGLERVGNGRVVSGSCAPAAYHPARGADLRAAVPHGPPAQHLARPFGMLSPRVMHLPHREAGCLNSPSVALEGTGMKLVCGLS